MKGLCFSLVYYNIIFTKTEVGDKIKYCRLPNDIETRKENTKELKTIEINWNKGRSFSEHWAKRIS